jgi:hypothetical protein
MSLFPTTIETERLALEQLSSETVDLPELYHICSTDTAINEITRYMPGDPHQTLNETHEFVEWCETGWGDGEQAVYVIRPSDSEDGAEAMALYAGQSTGLTNELPTASDVVTGPAAEAIEAIERTATVIQEDSS